MMMMNTCSEILLRRRTKKAFENDDKVIMSMEAEIMQMSFLVDKILRRLYSSVVRPMEEEEEIKGFQLVLYKIKDLMDAKSSVESWIIDHLRLEGMVFEDDEQVSRVEEKKMSSSSWWWWWRLVRLTLDDAWDVFDEIDIDYFALSTLREKLHALINLQPPNPRRIKNDEDDAIFGRQKDVNHIVQLLVSSSSSSTHTQDDDDVHVIPIVGDSGVGKTTLAKLVYNDSKLENYFDKKMWITINDTVVSNLDIVHLRESLHGQKFLLVLDGVLNDICCNWDDVLRVPLMTIAAAAAKGSRILVTTRSFLVSSIIGTVPPYNLQPLSYQVCWSLFQHRALAFGGDNNAIIPPAASLSYHQKMVKWFQGFPSLIIAFANFLHIKPNERDLDIPASVLESTIHHLNISSTMLWMYNGLSSMHLKQCFLYCALFPKGYEFQKQNLVWLWMAEGFLQSQGSMTAEEVGFKYLEDLIRISFLQLKYDDYLRRDCSPYIIPNPVHDLVQYMSGNEYLRIDNKETCLFENAHHVSICCEEASNHVFFKSLQTLLFIGKVSWGTHCKFVRPIEKLPQDFFLHLKNLCVLDLSDIGLLELCGSIGKLKHLRFLDISGNALRCLPEEMSMLHNLETLVIERSPELKQFPKEMEKLIGLRHLILGNGCQSFVIPPGLGKLTNLQALPIFIVGTGSDEIVKIEDLRELVHLRGSLTILKLNNVSHEEVTQGGWLVNKAHLEMLDLVWYYWPLEDVEIAQSLLASLQPHTNLVHLKISLYGGLKFPFWMGDPSFSNLETIELFGCNSCESLPPLGQLPCLKSLKIERMDSLKYIDDGFLGNMTQRKRFPVLKSLVLCELCRLEKWTGLGKCDMPLLKVLKVDSLGMLMNLPTLQYLVSLKELVITISPKIRSLPVKRLPSSLESIVISCCPLLAEKCRRMGELWWKNNGITLDIIEHGI